MFSAKAPIAEIQISVKIDGGVVLFKEPNLQFFAHIKLLYLYLYVVQRLCNYSYLQL